MMLKINCENMETNLEVDDDVDFSLMIQKDYEWQIARKKEEKPNAKRKRPEPKKRSVQEILDDELINKADYNCWHKYDRHVDKYGAYNKMVDDCGTDKDSENYEPVSRKNREHILNDMELLSEDNWREEFLDKISGVLTEKQIETIMAIFDEGYTAKEVAEREGCSQAAISKRVKAAKENLKKIFRRG